MTTLTDPITGEVFTYVTRSEWGARPPKQRYPIQNTSNGVFMHHTVTGTAPAAQIVRGVQNFHMDGRGWYDIAYSFLVDVINGVIYEGRGLGIAGGHTEGFNFTSHAVCWIANTDTDNPTAKAKRAWLAMVRVIEAQYGQGRRRGHRDVASTGCPGGYGYTWLQQGLPITGVEPGPDPTPRVLSHGMQGDDVKQWQTRLAGRGYWILADGDFGDLTEGVTRWFQEERGLSADGQVGPQTRSEMDKAEDEGWQPSLGGGIDVPTDRELLESINHRLGFIEDQVGDIHTAIDAEGPQGGYVKRDLRLGIRVEQGLIAGGVIPGPGEDDL